MEEIVLRILLKFYNEKKAKQKLPKQLSQSPRAFSIAKLLIKFNYDEEVVTKEFQRYLDSMKKKGTLDRYIERYGPEEGERRYKEKNSRLSVGRDALLANGHSLEEIERIKKSHSRKSAHTIENFQKRYGDKWEEEWNAYCKKMKDTCIWGITYWTDKGYSYNEAKQMVSNLQVRDYEYFKKLGWSYDKYVDLCNRKTVGFRLVGYLARYGIEEGLLKRKDDSGKSSRIEYWLEKDPETGEQVFQDLLAKRTKKSKESKIQLEFSQHLYDELSDYPEIQQAFKGAPISETQRIFFAANDFGLKMSLPDIRIKNIIIEIDGIYWHSIEHIKQRDFAKDYLRYQMGFDILRIFDSEIQQDFRRCINITKQFIIENIDLTFSMRRLNEN